MRAYPVLDTIAQKPVKKVFPKQARFAEYGTAVAGGSDHGRIYVFDLQTASPIDILRHGPGGLVQTITVSQMKTTSSRIVTNQLYQTHSEPDNTHWIISADSGQEEAGAICLWKYNPKNKGAKGTVRVCTFWNVFFVVGWGVAIAACLSRLHWVLVRMIHNQDNQRGY